MYAVIWITVWIAATVRAKAKYMALDIMNHSTPMILLPTPVNSVILLVIL